MNLLADAQTWLRKQRADYLAQTVTFARGEQSNSLKATRGESEHESDDGETIVKSKMVDWIIDRTDLTLADEQTLPEVGDTITDAMGHIYTVANLGSEKHYVEHGSDGQSIRVHSVLTGDVAATPGEPEVPAALPIIQSTPVAERNDFTGVIGFEFTANRELTIRFVGKTTPAPFANEHAVKIWRVSDQTCVASANVGPASEVDANGFSFAECSEGEVTLQAGQTYRICSDESSGGDAFVNATNMSGSYSTSDITVTAGCFGSSQGAYPASKSGAGIGFGFTICNLYE